MRRLVLVFVAACGGQTAAPVQVPAKRVEPPTPPATITCSDVGVILRGHVEDEKAAGPVKEEWIAKACLHDKWTRDVIDCVGRETHARGCLGKLTKEQRTAFRAKLAKWLDSYPDESLPSEDEEEELEYIACTNGIGDVRQYAPILTLKNPDLELAMRLRRTHVLALCEDWPTEVRRCFEQRLAIADCRRMLEPDQQQDLLDRIAEVDALMKRIADAGAPDCKKVVAAHYADANWKGKLAAMKPGERKKIIAESRTRMTKACIDDQWSTSTRGCIVVRGGDQCFTASNMTSATWGFPANGIAIKTGIPECDSYGDALRALVVCNAIPKQAAQQMLDSFQLRAPAWASSSAAERTAAAKSCSQSDAAIRQSAKSLGCAI